MGYAPNSKSMATWSNLDDTLKFWQADDLLDQPLQNAMSPFVAHGGNGRLEVGVMYLTLAVQGRHSAAALDYVAKVPYTVTLQLTNSDNLNDRDLGRLKGAGNLKRLDLAGATYLGDEELRQVAALTSLESLALNSMHVTDKGLAHLHTLVHLRTLRMENDNVTPEGIAAIKKALPKLKVMR